MPSENLEPKKSLGIREFPGAAEAERHQCKMEVWLHGSLLEVWCYRSPMGPWELHGTTGVSRCLDDLGPRFVGSCWDPSAIETTWCIRSYLSSPELVGAGVSWGSGFLGAHWEPGCHRSHQRPPELSGTCVQQESGLPRAYWEPCSVSHLRSWEIPVAAIDRSQGEPETWTCSSLLKALSWELL